MERIVLGLSAINFNSSNDILTDKPVISNIETWPNQTFSFSYAMATAAPVADDEEIESPGFSETSNQSDSESTPPHRRSLPSRMAKSKENSLLRIKRRSIMKPKRNLNVEIKKLYLDNKIKGKFRPSNLETIFEEPTPDKNKQLCFVGTRKIRRSLSCSDGLNVTKTTVKSRRLKIKKTFGRRFALKKISLDDFIDRLNASFEDKPTTSQMFIPTEEKADETTDCANDNEASMEYVDETPLLV